MDIYQLQAIYVAQQDRILLRLNTHAHQEYRLWLTRRMLTSFLPHLVQVSEQLTPAQAPNIGHDTSHDGADRSALTKFQRQEAVARADFETAYNADLLTLPIGAEPLLPSQIQVMQLTNRHLCLSFQEEAQGDDKPRDMQVTLSPEILHSFLHLMDLVLKAADWGVVTLPAAPPTESRALDDFANAQAPRLLH